MTKVRTSVKARTVSRSQWSLGSELPQVHETLLPRELEQKLSTLGAEYRRVRARNDVLLVNAKTRTVIDVLRDIHVTV